MTARRSISAALERCIIMHQLAEGYLGFRARDGMPQLLCGCGCGLPILSRTPVIHEHMIPLALGGADNATNIRLYRKECAAKKTNGRSKATSYGSDIHAIAKCKRIRGETCNGPKRKIPQRQNPWGRQKVRKVK